MFRSLIVLATAFFSLNASAIDMNKPLLDMAQLQEHTMELASAQPSMINWRVGENADYNVNTGFLPGSMKMLVREATPRGYWIEQNIDLLIQKQKAEIHLDKNTGEIIEFLVNGQPQEMPDQGDAQVVDNREDTVTVPAGTFDCLYVKTRNSKGEEAEVWANPQVISVFGLAKQAAQAQGQNVVIELTAFQK